MIEDLAQARGISDDRLGYGSLHEAGQLDLLLVGLTEEEFDDALERWTQGELVLLEL